MKKAVVCMVMIAIVMGTACATYASVEDDAKALAQKCALFIKENGREKEIAEIMNPKGRFSAQLKAGKLNLG